MDGLRIFVGHAGWAPAQLEAEIQQRDWTLKRVETEAIFSGKSEHPWPSPASSQTQQLASSAAQTLTLLRWPLHPDTERSWAPLSARRSIWPSTAKRSLRAALIGRPEAHIRQTETSARCQPGEHPRACHRRCGHRTWPKAVSSSRRASGAAVLAAAHSRCSHRQFHCCG